MNENWISVSRFLGSLRSRLMQLHPSANCSLKDDHMVHVHFKEEIGIAELIPLVTTYIILFAYIYFSTREFNSLPVRTCSVCFTYFSLLPRVPSCFVLHVLFFTHNASLNLWKVPTIRTHASFCASRKARTFMCQVFFLYTLFTAVKMHPANNSVCPCKH